MDNELKQNVSKLENTWLAKGDTKNTGVGDTVNGSKIAHSSSTKDCYDQVYFDSDEEGDGPGVCCKLF